MRKHRRLTDLYRFPGFVPSQEVSGVFGDPRTRVVRLKRRSKKTACGACGRVHRTFYDRKVRRVRDKPCGDCRVFLEMEVRRVLCKNCGMVKKEKFACLADNPFYTKRLAYYVGKRCSTSTIKDVAQELKLGWKSVKELDKQYMREKLRHSGKPSPKVIGIDEISVRKGHTYKIVVSDLKKSRPIWFGGEDRSEESMELFYEWLGPSRCARIRLAVMEMWPALENATPTTPTPPSSTTTSTWPSS